MSVILEPINDESIYNNAEPQSVKLVPRTSLHILISSAERAKGSPYKFSVNSDSNKLYLKSVAPVSINAQLSIPNINSRNNQVSYQVQGDANTYTVTLSIGYYTANQFEQDLIAGMNAISPGPVFSSSSITKQRELVITSDTTLFRFVSSNMVTRGKYMMQISQATSYTQSKGIYNLNMVYTPIVYVRVDPLQSEMKLMSHVHGKVLEYFASFPIIDGTNGLSLNQAIMQTEYRMNPNRSVTSLNVELIDVFGEQIEAYAENRTTDFFILDIRAAI